MFSYSKVLLSLYYLRYIYKHNYVTNQREKISFRIIQILLCIYCADKNLLKMNYSVITLVELVLLTKTRLFVKYMLLTTHL